MASWTKIFASVVLAGTITAGAASDVSAASAHYPYYGGHAYRGHSGPYAYGYNRHRHYGASPAAGAAVAGAALGIFGLAAGAAAANRYDDGYGSGYGAPVYGGGYGYAPGGYGYAPGGYAPYEGDDPF